MKSQSVDNLHFSLSYSAVSTTS